MDHDPFSLNYYPSLSEKVKILDQNMSEVMKLQDHIVYKFNTFITAYNNLIDTNEYLMKEVKMLKDEIIEKKNNNKKRKIN
jgi:hypothetical protein